jgi:hypothetical protein
MVRNPELISNKFEAENLYFSNKLFATIKKMTIISDVSSSFGWLHSMAVDDVADVSDAYGASIFRVECTEGMSFGVSSKCRQYYLTPTVNHHESLKL